MITECNGTADAVTVGPPILRHTDETGHDCCGHKHPLYTVLCPRGHYIMQTTRPDDWRDRTLICTGGADLDDERKRELRNEYREKYSTTRAAVI